MLNCSSVLSDHNRHSITQAKSLLLLAQASRGLHTHYICITLNIQLLPLSEAQLLATNSLLATNTTMTVKNAAASSASCETMASETSSLRRIGRSLPKSSSSLSSEAPSRMDCLIKALSGEGNLPTNLLQSIIVASSSENSTTLHVSEFHRIETPILQSSHAAHHHHIKKRAEDPPLLS